MYVKLRTSKIHLELLVYDGQSLYNVHKYIYIYLFMYLFNFKGHILGNIPYVNFRELCQFAKFDNMTPDRYNDKWSNKSIPILITIK